MRLRTRPSGLAKWSRPLAALALVAVPVAEAVGDDTAGISSRGGRRPIELWPRTEKEQSDRRPGSAINLGGWLYRAIKAPDARGGVPWQLIVTPSVENEGIWQKGAAGGGASLSLNPVRTRATRSRQSPKAEDVPVVEIPQILWRQRMSADLQDVVGIHFHEYTSDDFARILFTLHKVPPDDPDGTPATPGSYAGRPGTRIEATLLAPVVWTLDQSIVVRVDTITEPIKDKRDRLARSRSEHESGHAEVSQQVLMEILRGPQDWNPQYCTGRRSQFEYYSSRRQIGRSWDGYQRSVGKLLTLRTSIALVPPTRWSKLLPVPPERVTSKHIEQFNDEIVLLGPRLTAVDSTRQKQFHAHHGEYESGGSP